MAYFDNGVGTSSIRFLAVFWGVFGFGLHCRHHTPWQLWPTKPPNGENIPDRALKFRDASLGQFQIPAST